EPKIASGFQCAAKQTQAWWTRNPALAEEAVNCLETTPTSGSASSARALAQTLRHDWQPLAAYREPVSPGYAEVERVASEAEVRLYGQIERGPSPALAQSLQDFVAAEAAEVGDSKLGPSYRALEITYYEPLEAQALAKLSRTGEAAALIAKTPLDCYNCLRA